MSNTAKNKGTAFETLCVRYLAQWFPGVTRSPLRGTGDTGDIDGISNASGRRVTIQCKNHKTFKLSEWLTATKEQADRNGNALPILLAKRRGVGASSMGRTYAVLELSDLVDLLSEAGYG